MHPRLSGLPIAGALLFAATAIAQSPTTPAHTVASFDFTVAAPFSRVSPQFGPEAERAWGDPTWDPHFLYPVPARDMEGAVFTLQHGDHTAVWINTRFDVANGRMQYVYVIPDILLTVIDVHVIAAGAAGTHVHVQYTRTALTSEHNKVVEHMAKADMASATEWQRQVEHSLGITKP